MAHRVGRGIALLSMTAALEGGEWSAARPFRTLPLGKTRYPFYRRLGGHQGRSGRAENLVSTGIRSRTVQPIAQKSVAIPTELFTPYFIKLITYRLYPNVTKFMKLQHTERNKESKPPEI